MAVPKKKMSKSKRDMRRYVWKKKVLKQVLIALSFSNLSEVNNSLKSNIGE